MADEWDSYIVKDQPQADEWSQYEVKPSAQPLTQKVDSGMDSILGGAVGIGAAGLGTALALKSGKAINSYLQAPNRLLKPLDVKLEGIQSQFPSLVGTRTSDLPGLLKGQGENYSQTLKAIERNVAVGTEKLSQRVDDLNKTVLTKNFDELAVMVKTGAPQLFDDVSNTYAETLKSYDGIMKDNKVSFTNKDVAKLLGDVKDKAIRNGVPENRLAFFSKLEEGLNPAKVDVTKKLSFSNTKSLVDNALRNSDKETTYVIRELWGDLLEKKAPQEVSKDFKLLQSKFKNFAEARNKLNAVARMPSGEYDMEGLRKYFANYADNMAQTDKKNIINLLSEGKGLVKPIEGFGSKAGEFTKNISKKISLEDALDNIKTFSLDKKQQFGKIVESYSKWSTKAEELISQKAKIAEKYPLRTGGFKKVIGEAGKAAGRGLIFKGLGGFALGALDPTSRIMGDPIENISRIIQGKRPTAEEWKKFQEANIL